MTTGLDLNQFNEYVIEPTLEELGLYSVAAAQLVLGTCIQESRLRYLKQLGGGPALGVVQMEPATHHDIWRNFLAYRPTLTARVREIAGVEHPPAQMLIGNLWYAVAMCRVHYRRVRAALPTAGDIDAQAQYWKRYYNTSAGKGTVEQYIANWRKAHER